MKRLFNAAVCSAIILMLSACGGGKETPKSTVKVPQISPESLVSAETASTVSGATMKMTDDGVVQDGNTLTVTYVAEPLGSADTVSVSIEQFSDKVSTNDTWTSYEYNRVHRGDMEFIQGLGQDCYIAYPYINVYDRGCYIKISAGSGSGEAQKTALINLATQAASVIEQTIPEEAVEDASGNIIK